MIVPTLALMVSAIRPSFITSSLSASPYLATKARSAQAVTVKVDANAGDTLSGERTFKVLVGTEDIVIKVEFYISGQLISSETSTPYRFTLDTVNQPDGPIDLKWVAYTDQGKKGSKILKLKVDNGMAAGVAPHLQTGLSDLQDGKLEAAVTEGRIALKIDKKSTGARFLLARAYLAQDVYDKAQKYVQDVLDDEPKNLEALDISSAISVKQAFATFSRGDKNAEALDTIGTAFKSSAEARRKYVDAKFDSVGAPTAQNILAYADAAIGALRYSDAISTLDGYFRKAPNRADLADRLAYCQLRLGRFTDAIATIDLLKKVGGNSSDAYSQALYSLVLNQQGNTDGSDSAMQDAVLNDLSNLGVETAQASIALQRHKDSVLASLVTSLAKDEGQRTEVNYLLCALENALGNYPAARPYFRTALLAEPLNYDMFIEQGNFSLNTVVHGKLKKEDADFDYSSAEMLFKSALACKADSYQALNGLALVYLLQGKASQAMKYAQAASDAQPTWAASHYTLAAAATAVAKGIRPRALPTDDAGKRDYDDAVRKANTIDGQAVDELRTAGKLDQSNIAGRSVPSAADAFDYFYRYGRSPIISRPS